MKKGLKIKKRFLTMLSCVVLGAALSPAVLAAGLPGGPATGDPMRQYLPLIIGVAVSCLVIVAALVVISAKKKKSGSGEGPSVSQNKKASRDDEDHKG